MYAPPQVYRVDKSVKKAAQANKKREQKKKQGSFASSDGVTPPTSSHAAPPHSAPPHVTSHNINGLLDPAVDGPPSRERIRLLSKQMKRTSLADKHKSNLTNSSGSSSHSRLSFERPSWEHAIESISLSRRSSERSTSSSMPSRERPDSVQIFGKTIFNRRTRLRRESVATQSSSSSSMYATEPQPHDVAMLPPLPVNGKETLIPTIFNRRRTMRVDQLEDLATQRRFQISGPYNFQHVTHTQRDHLPNLQRTNRIGLANEMSALRAAQAPTNGALRGIHADDLHYGEYSTEGMAISDESYPNMAHDVSEVTTPQKTSPSRRVIKHTRSQEQLRAPHRRQPGSPSEQSYPAPPVPPPRGSSRAGMRPEDELPTSTPLDRPMTAGANSFRHPLPLSFLPEDSLPPLSAPLYPTDSARDRRYSRMVVPAEEPNWPLTSDTALAFEAALSDVAEEEDNFLSRRSRASMISTNSSLKGSQSVPLLRQLLHQPHAASSQRPPSGTSETLGRLDLFAAQRALKAAAHDGDMNEAMPRMSWEDDIDYCYEHEAEADCDYEWERPSLDLTRDDDDLDDEEDERPIEMAFGTKKSNQLSPGRARGRFDIPALSPASQASNGTAHEAITPTAPAIPNSSPYLSRPDFAVQPRYVPLHRRSDSQASSFKESHGFNLSPSLLIQDNFRQQMALVDEQDRILDYDNFTFNEPALTTAKLNLGIGRAITGGGIKNNSRTSASTTSTNDSGTRSMSGSDRHISSASTSTDLTRLTTSTSSLDIDSFIPKHDAAIRESFPSGRPDEPELPRSSMKAAMPALFESEEPIPVSPVLETKPLSPTSLEASSPTSVSSSGPGPSLIRRRGSQHRSRSRSNTATMPSPPPTGQYAMFPTMVISGARI